ncbi:gamma-glutamyltransferase family protein [Candidatus Binatus sp.]|uniref:gamma-glutamyltransferase family protein n=1 Tax=Candidatus Binatus sp. TaxID=2811406 RepID=UPI003CC55045
MPTIYPLIMGRRAMIATEHYLSAAAGARIFACGGNAIDAAIAATFVEGVVNPHMHTIGGEAPMLIYSASARRVVAINGNMMAPARATIAHYRALGLELIPGAGLLAAGVPAAFDALVTALRDFGTRSLADVLEPALQLASDGIPMHEGLSGDPDLPDEAVAGAGASLRNNAKRFLTKWPSSGRVYLPDGKVPMPGSVLKNPALANFFKRVLDSESSAKNRGRESGLDAARDRFYRGDIARDIVAWSDASGGLLGADDLAHFTTRAESPASADYRGVTVFKCGPWSQGPVFLQQLKLLEGFDLAAMGHNSADYIHTVIEAAKLSFADREAYYGDPEFIDVPLDALLSDRYAAIRRDLIDAAQASMEQRPGDPIAMRAMRAAPTSGARPWGGGTIHVTAADRDGNMIAVTASGGWIPSSPVIDALGFPLGTRMQTFYLDERHPNALMPGKRPRTTLSPSLAMRKGEPYLAFGTPGGDQQDQWTLQFFLNVVDFAMDLQAAIEAPKFSTPHFPSTFYPHDNRPGVLRIEDRVPANVRDALAARGHKIEVRPSWSEGRVLGVQINTQTGVLAGGADPRGQAAPVMPAQVIGW